MPSSSLQFSTPKMDKITPERRSENMRKIRGKGMKPELMVRKLTHGMGYRYRLHLSDLPGKPDLVFIGRKKAIFVHGCFWHQHPASSCKIVRVPKSNQDYWLPKLKRNAEKDIAVKRQLQRSGWGVLVIWECQTKNIQAICGRISKFLGPTRLT